MACGHRGVGGPVAREAVMVGSIFAPVRAQTRNLRVMEDIASDQIKWTAFATLHGVQVSGYV